MKNILAITLLFLAGCTIKVHTGHDRQVDFSKYKTFCWLQGCEFIFKGPSYMQDSVVKARMQKAIIEEMKTKGIRYNPDAPDLLMDVQITIAQDTAFIYRRDDDLYFTPFMQPQQILMLKGTLVMDLVDHQTSKVVWRSVAVSFMEQYPKLTEQNFRKGVKSALRGFPPRKK